MKREETKRVIGKGTGPYTKTLIGKAWDEGVKEGYREGFKEANNYCSTTVIACMLLALNDVYGFSTIRMARLVPAIQQKLFDTLSATEAAEEVKRRFGIVIEDDELFQED